MKALLQLLLLFTISLNAKAQFDERDFPENRIIMSGSGALKLPAGTTGQRPTGIELLEGMTRLNTDTVKVEVYKGGIWVNVSGATQFSDDEFEIYDDVDPTKIVKFDASVVLPGNTRTYTLPDSSGVFSLLGIDQTFTGLNTFSDDIIMIGTGQIQIPVGTTLQRSSSPIEGMLRYNTDLAEPEIYAGGTWQTIGDINAILGPGASTNNAVARWDSTTGKFIQDSTLIVDDLGRISQPSLFQSTVIGENAALNDDGTNSIIAIGPEAVNTNVTGNGIIGIGYQAAKRTTGNYNLAIGDQALENSNNVNAIGNIAIGTRAMQSSNSSAVTNNVAIGLFSQRVTGSGSSNVSVGSESLENNITGDRNVAIGYKAGTRILAHDNVAIGNLAMSSEAGGNMQRNVVIGSLSASDMRNGEDNILIGYDIETVNNYDDFKLNIGNFLYGDMATTRLGVGVPLPTTGLDVAGGGKFDGQLEVTQHADIYTIDTTGNVNVGGTGHMKVPSGNTAQRTSLPIDGMMRYNYELLQYEGVTGGAWAPLAGGTGGGDVFGPVGSTDNAIVRYNGTTGKIIQDSNILINDLDDISGVNDLAVAGTTTLDTSLNGVAKVTAGVISASLVDLTADVTGVLLLLMGVLTSQSTSL